MNLKDLYDLLGKLLKKYDENSKVLYAENFEDASNYSYEINYCYMVDRIDAGQTIFLLNDE